MRPGSTAPSRRGASTTTAPSNSTSSPATHTASHLTGSNGDSNETLRGELVLGTALPTDCADAQALYADEDDGRYVIVPSGGQRFSVHCADMDATAKDYLELHPQVTGPGLNFSSYAAGGAAPGTTVTPSFTKVRFDPATFLVESTTGRSRHPPAA